MSVEEVAKNEDEGLDEQHFILEPVPSWDEEIYRQQIAAQVYKSLLTHFLSEMFR